MLCPIVADRRGAAEVRKQVSSAYLGDVSKSTTSSIVSFTTRQNVRVIYCDVSLMLIYRIFCGTFDADDCSVYVHTHSETQCILSFASYVTSSSKLCYKNLLLI